MSKFVYCTNNLEVQILRSKMYRRYNNYKCKKCNEISFSDRFSIFDKLPFCIAVAMCDLVHDVASTFELRHEKTNVLVFDQVRHKPGCSITEDG